MSNDLFFILIPELSGPGEPMRFLHRRSDDHYSEDLDHAAIYDAELAARAIERLQKPSAIAISASRARGLAVKFRTEQPDLARELLVQSARVPFRPAAKVPLGAFAAWRSWELTPPDRLDGACAARFDIPPGGATEANRALLKHHYCRPVEGGGGERDGIAKPWEDIGA